MRPLALAFGEIDEILDGLGRVFLEQTADNGAFGGIEGCVHAGLTRHKNTFQIKMLMWGQPSSAVQLGVPGRSALAYCGFADFFGVADVARSSWHSPLPRVSCRCAGSPFLNCNMIDPDRSIWPVVAIATHGPDLLDQRYRSVITLSRSTAC